MTASSATSIVAVTPAHTAGAVDVVVTDTDSQSGSLTCGYTFQDDRGDSGVAEG